LIGRIGELSALPEDLMKSLEEPFREFIKSVAWQEVH
jgi:hypothetical protein